MPVTVYPKGVTIYMPEKCSNGYTGYPFPVDGEPGAVLSDMNGRIVHEWKADSSRLKGGVPRARFLENGHMLILRPGVKGQGGGGQEYDWDGSLVWEYATPAQWHPHHDIFRKDNGNTLLICREVVPEEYRRMAGDAARREMLYSDVIIEVTPDNDVVWEWHQYDQIDIERCNPIPAPRDWWAGPDNNTVTDWTHTNTVQAIPPNQWYDKGDGRFKPGNVLMSLRQLDLVLLVDRDTGEIVWEYTGDYKGGMSGQHDSHMIEKGIPGAGNVLIFDNGASPYKDLAHAGCSYVIEVDPTSDKVVWVYDNGELFHSNFTASSQRLPNGNTLILEPTGGRIFEVTAESEIVWEHVFPMTSARPQRAYRYAYDYSPQTKALGKPDEAAVIPEA